MNFNFLIFSKVLDQKGPAQCEWLRAATLEDTQMIIMWIYKNGF